MYFKKMTGQKCYLSPMETSDLELFTAWVNDMEVINFLNIAPASISASNEKEFLDKLSREHNYEIIDLKTDTPIGTCGLIEIDHMIKRPKPVFLLETRTTGGRATEPRP